MATITHTIASGFCTECGETAEWLTERGAAMVAATAKTECGQHRTVGYALNAGVWTCRGCGLPADQHETLDETIARTAA